jgi:hypothetical protein
MMLLTWQCVAQEVSLSALPPKMQQPTPDSVVYHMFLRHLAAFDQLAQRAQSQGEDPQPRRNHILHKFGLTTAEQQNLTPIALQYDAQWRSIQNQEESVIAAYKQLYFPTGKWLKGQPLPPTPSEIKTLRESAVNLALRAKAQVQTSLGVARFAVLDAILRSHGMTQAHPTQGAAQ